MVDQDTRPRTIEASSLRGKLVVLAKEQRAEAGEQPKLFGEGLQLLADFTHTDAFRQRCIQLIGYLSEPKDEEELREISHRFSGAIFEDIAFMYASENLPEGYIPENVVLISHKRTYQFCESIVPIEGEVPPFENGPLPPRGVHFPDGLLVTDDGEIRAVYEYSLMGGRGYFHMKKYADKGDLGVVLDEPKLIGVVTSKSRVHTEGMGFVPVPFDNIEFGSFINNIYSHLEEDMDMELPEIAKHQLDELRSFTPPINLKYALVHASEKQLAQGRELMFVMDQDMPPFPIESVPEFKKVFRADALDGLQVDQVLERARTLSRLDFMVLNEFPEITEGPYKGWHRYVYGKGNKRTMDFKIVGNQMFFSVGQR